MTVDFDDVVARSETALRRRTILSDFADERWTVANDGETERVIDAARDDKLNADDRCHGESSARIRLT